jgi:hypothetical protein
MIPAMIPEGPIFGFTSTDLARVEIHATVPVAVDHLVNYHHDDQEFLADLLCFDGLARVVDVQPSGKRFQLVATSEPPDPWHVRGRVLTGIVRVLADLKGQYAGAETIPFSAGDRSADLPTDRFLNESQGIIESLASAETFAEFAELCADLCDPASDDPARSWLCCVFHRPCCN